MLRIFPAIALAGVLAALLLATAAAEDEAWYGTDPADELAITLRPGLNPVGWTAATTTPDALFEAIPQAEAIFAWDAPRQQWLLAGRDAPEPPQPLREIATGTGLLIRLGGDQPVEWTRPILPARGTVKLRPGSNFVAWAGRDDVPLAHALRGIGVSLETASYWDSEAMEWRRYDPSADAENPPSLRRGDPLWTTLPRSVVWLQPTYLQPKIIGGSERLLDDLGKVRRHFDRQYAVQAEAADLTIELSGNDARCAGSAGCYSTRDDRIYLHPHRYSDDLFAHEYFHALQYDLMNWGDNHYPDLSLHRAWLIEGSAELAAWDYALSNDLPIWAFGRQARSWPELRGLAERILSANTPRLPTRDETWEYSHGAIALNRVAGADNRAPLVELWRLLSPVHEIAGREWDSGYDLHVAFAGAFDIWLTEFLQEFNGWVDGIIAKRGAERSLGPILAGTIAREDGRPVSARIVRAYYHSERESINPLPVAAATTDMSGNFSLNIVSFRRYLLAVELEPGCHATVAGGGITFVPERAESFSPGGAGIAGIEVAVPAGACTQLMTGTLRTRQDQPISGVAVIACVERPRVLVAAAPLGCGSGRTDEAGNFRLALPDGGERRHVAIRLCRGGRSWFWDQTDAAVVDMRLSLQACGWAGRAGEAAAR